jgi:hypothetical protein
MNYLFHHERLRARKVRFFIGTVVQFCPGFSVTLICRQCRVPLNRPAVAVPVIVAMLYSNRWSSTMEKFVVLVLPMSTSGDALEGSDHP